MEQFTDGSKSTRRRGDDLLDELYEATLKLASHIQPTSLTFQQIAEAAHTSRAVLYRRWSSVFDLLQSAYTYKAETLFEGAFFADLLDTGSLRTDLIQLLTIYQQVCEAIGIDILNHYYYLRMLDPDNRQEPLVHQTALIKHRHAVEVLLHRARARAEATKPVDPLTLMLPYDLIRIENLIRPSNMSPRRIELLVDEVLLPVFGVTA